MWQRHRSAPVGATVAGTLALLATSTASVVFYVSVVRGARGLPAYTAGLPPARAAFPLRQRSVYGVSLAGPEARHTPAGTPSVAHRWRVDDAAITPGAGGWEPLCAGRADDEVLAVDASGARSLALPLPEALYVAGEPRAVPERLVATCPALANGQIDPARLRYREWWVPPGTPVQVVACAFQRRPMLAPAAPAATGVPPPDARDPGALGPCDDGAPSRVYPVEGPAAARARARGAVLRIAAWAAAFAAACFGAGVLALRRFDRARGAPA